MCMLMGKEDLSPLGNVCNGEDRNSLLLRDNDCYHQVTVAGWRCYSTVTADVK